MIKDRNALSYMVNEKSNSNSYMLTNNGTTVDGHLVNVQENRGSSETDTHATRDTLELKHSYSELMKPSSSTLQEQMMYRNQE